MDDFNVALGRRHVFIVWATCVEIACCAKRLVFCFFEGLSNKKYVWIEACIHFLVCADRLLNGWGNG